PATAVPATVPAAKRGYKIKFGASWGEYRKKETVRLRGRVTLDGKRARKGTKGEPGRTHVGSKKTTKIATLTTSKKGKYAYRLRPGKDASYVARVGSTSSRTIKLDRTTGDR